MNSQEVVLNYMAPDNDIKIYLLIGGLIIIFLSIFIFKKYKK